MLFICMTISLINAETMPRFDMRDKDGIIFDPIAPRAGERLSAKCTLVGLTPNDKRHVSWTAIVNQAIRVSLGGGGCLP